MVHSGEEGFINTENLVQVSRTLEDTRDTGRSETETVEKVKI